jgi:hypothetical protein
MKPGSPTRQDQPGGFPSSNRSNVASQFLVAVIYPALWQKYVEMKAGNDFCSSNVALAGYDM